MEKTHWRKHDYRIESLKLVISGIEESINKLKLKIEEEDWYDGGWFIEEAEPMLGLCFVAFQNYINSSIYDRFEHLTKQYEKYKLGKYSFNSKRTDIELIIAIANYFKHRDSQKKIFTETIKILNDFNLQSKEWEFSYSPIYKGFDILSKENKLSDLINIVETWREELWK